MTELELKDVIHAGVGAVLCGLGWLCKAGWKMLFQREYQQHKCWTVDFDGDVRESKIRFFKGGQITVRAIGQQWVIANADGSLIERSYVKRWWLSNSKPPLI